MTKQTQKDRMAFADYWGVEVGEVYWCDNCAEWTWLDEDDQVAKCGCY